MNTHLAEIARRVAPGAHAILVLDGAGFAVLSSNAVTISGNMSAFSVRPTTLTQQAMLDKKIV